MIKNAKKKPFISGTFVESLEPRILLSADIPGFDVLTAEPDLERAPSNSELLRSIESQSSGIEIIQDDIDLNEQATIFSGSQLIIVDSAVNGYQQLISDIQSQISGSGSVEIVILDAQQDGIEQINDLLFQRTELSTVHLLSHGSDATMHLGATTLTNDNLANRAAEIEQWANAFSDTGDLLIYGCDIASSNDGELFLNQLAHLTQTDVAASDDLTGSTLLGGNWQLEYQKGAIEPNSLILSQMQGEFADVLANVAPTAADDSYTLPEDGSLVVDLLPSFDGGNLANSGSTGTQSRDSQLVDIDGDGDLDILSSTQAANEVSWLENTDGLGTFGGEQVITSAAWGVRAVAAVDLDGDGDLDVLVGSAHDDTISWFQNDGAGNFGAEQFIATDVMYVSDVTAADVDGDGHLDVVVADYQGDSLIWYKNTNGLGNFGAAQVIDNTINGASSIQLVDIDGDSDLDIVSASYADATIAWYENTNGLGAFGPKQALATDAFGANTVVVADIDGDGDLDVVANYANRDSVVWFSNNGVGSFSAAQVISSAIDGAYGIAVDDLDGDGDQDVVVTGERANTVSWFENTDGIGGFGSEIVLSNTIARAMYLDIGDIDGDGHLDVLAESYDNGDITWFKASQDYLTSNDIDPDGDSLSTILVTDVSNGVLVLNNDGSFTYTPDDNFNGVDSFSYKINDGTVDSNTATVTLNVTAVNDEPQGLDKTISAIEDTDYVFNISDFGFSDTADSPANNFTHVIITTASTGGTLYIDNDGNGLIDGGEAVADLDAIATADIIAGKLKFKPTADANGAGSDSFTFQVKDDGGTANGGVDTDTTPNTITIDISAVNDAPTGSVSIDNTSPAQGDLLTASNTLADVDGMGAITYTWKADGSSVGTGTTHLLTQAEVGKTITVEASYTDGESTLELVASSATASVSNVNDAPTGSVSIDNISPAQGDLLTASNTLADADGLGTITYTWKADGSTVGTGATYLLTQTEVGKTITVEASYSDGGGHAEMVASSTTAAVANVNDAPTGSVSIDNTTPAQGDLLTASNTLADADGLGAITYIWKADGSTIGTGSTYTLTQSEVGKTITVEARYTDGYGQAEVVASSTAAVANVNDAPTGSVSIDNTSPAQGDLLTASNTLADVDGLGAITYTWKADGSTVGTGATYLLTQAEVGKTITVEARYSDGGGATETVASSAIASVTNINDAPSGSVSIDNTSPAQGDLLTASNTLADADGLGVITYTWKADGSTIGTGSTYTLTQSEVGKTITVEAAYTDALGQNELVASSATNTVSNVDDAAVITGDNRFTGNEGDSVVGILNATDVEGLTDSTYFSVKTPATHGTAFIDPITGAWNFSPTDSNWYGSDSFVITVTDDLGGTTDQVINITLANVDDAAVITGDNRFTGNEGDSVVGILNATDVEGLTDSTYFSVKTQATHGTAFIDPITGEWSFSPTDGNWYGSDSFVITVTDDLGGITEQVINITLANVDDLAIITGDLRIERTPAQNIVGNINATDVDGLTDGTYFSVVSQGAGGSAMIDAETGQWSYTPNEPNWSGNDQFEIMVTDDLGGTTKELISVNIIKPNSSPSFISNPITEGTIDSPYQYNINVTDSDGDKLTFSASGLPSWLMLVESGNGTARLIGVPDSSALGSHSIIITVSDGLVAISQTFTISVAENPMAEPLPPTEEPGNPMQPDPPAEEDISLIEGVNIENEEDKHTVVDEFEWLKEGENTFPDEVLLTVLNNEVPIHAIDNMESKNDSLGKQRIIQDLLINTKSMEQIALNTDALERKSSFDREMEQALEELDIATETHLRKQKVTQDTLIGMSVAFTGGAFGMLMRGGSTLISLLLNLPMWRRFDPLPILAEHNLKQQQKEKEENGEHDGKDRTIDDLFK